MKVNIDKVIQILKPRLERHEGLILKPYRDTKGNLTIGIGRNLDAKGISKDEAYFLLENDIADSISDVVKNLPWSTELDDGRFSVLVEMAFQMGIKGLLSFKKFLAHLQNGEYDKAADEMLDSKWARIDSPYRAIILSKIIRGGGDGNI